MSDQHAEETATTHERAEGLTMAEGAHVKNIFETNPLGSMAPLLMGGGMGGVGAGAGAGLGAGLLGGILGGVLFRNGALGGAGDVGGVVTPALLASSLAQVTETAQNSTVLQTLGDIKAAVPLAEGQVQLALSVAQADINSNVSQGNALITKSVSDAIAASLASQNNINVNVLQTSAAVKEAVTTYGVANLTATKDAQFATSVAIANSTKEILAALTAQNTATLERQLTVAETALLEQRAVSRSRDVEVNVTQNVAQTQAQVQTQQQQQQQAILLNTILAHLGNLQIATATNSQLIVGNTGAVAAGPQTANPVNVRT